MKNELLGKDERVWWADLLSQEEMDSEFDIAVGMLMSEHPKQGPLEWQGRLFEVVPKSELQRVNKVCDMQALLVSEYQELICDFLGMKSDSKKLKPSPHDARLLLDQLKMLHEREIQKLKGGSNEP